MKILYILLVAIFEFYCLIKEFIDKGGMNFKLLKIIMQMIMLLFALILLNYRKDLIKYLKEDYLQRQIEHYFKKEN